MGYPLDAAAVLIIELDESTDANLANNTLSTPVFISSDTGGGDPITFSDGTVASGLGFSYVTDVAFSDQPGGSPVGYTPVPDADGFDPAVTGFVVSPSGTMNGATGGNNPSFTIRFRVRLR